MKAITVALAPILILALLLGGCGYSEEELDAAREASARDGLEIGWAEGWEAGYEAGWEECRAYYGGAEGSVVEFWADWLSETYYEYTRLRLTARVMNVGDDGAFSVRAEMTEGDVHGTRSRSTKIYLKKGQETTVDFDFWVQGAVSYSVWCPR